MNNKVNEPLSSITVTKINKRWHSRLFVDGKLYDEMACKLQVDIGYICREMLRWFDKAGGNKFSSSSRKRRANDEPKGRIWYQKDLLK